jgi:hypothetical protein
MTLRGNNRIDNPGTPLRIAELVPNGYNMQQSFGSAAAKVHGSSPSRGSLAEIIFTGDREMKSRDEHYL